MGWRRDEVWLDVDVLWFRERADVHGGASLALRAAAFFAVPAPNGLSESRWRRAERRRRRQARRTRAAALVIAPAAMLTVGGQRLGDGSRGAGGLEVDPPSLTLRLGGPETRAQPAGLSGAGGVAPPRASRDDETAEPPTIEWRNATSHGLPYAGSLSAGTQLPVEGPDWVTWNPVADIVPNEPHRLYGNERTIRRIIAVAAAYRAANPGAPRVVVGDISFRGGGPMEAHVSHQNGLDVDVYYPRLDGRLREPRTPAQIDRRLAQDLLDRFVAAGAQMVFVGYSTGLHGAREVVIPYPSHENHLHVRFRPPGG